MAPKKTVKTVKTGGKKKTIRNKHRIYIQDLTPTHFRVGALCMSANSNQASTRKRMSKLPREDPARCLWRARLGKDGEKLYFAVRLRIKNPHYRGTGSTTGRGFHYSTRWKVVYDKRTGKAFDAKKHMNAFLRGRLM